MKTHSVVFGIALVIGVVAVAQAAVIATTQHGATVDAFDGGISNIDIIAGLIGLELPGDLGWHPANTNPADQLPAFTDGAGMLASGLTGLLNDFPPAGQPTKLVQYDFPPADIDNIAILTGNLGADGRVFSTTAVYGEIGDSGTFDLLAYLASDPSGTVNGGRWQSTLVIVEDDGGAPLLAGATGLQFAFYAVDNTGGEYRDPFDGVNPFTGVDDGLTAPIVSPLVLEIDVNGLSSDRVIPEPVTATLLLLGLAGLRTRRARRRRT